MVTKEVALISGASKGIGREVAKYFAENGINLILIARDVSALNELAEDLLNKFGIEAKPIPLDISNRGNFNGIIKKTIQEMGGIDIVVNVAGYPLDTSLWKKKIHELNEDEILNIIQVDFLGSFRIVKECLPFMIRNKKGIIINTSSIPAIDGDFEGVAYAFSKACCIILTKFLARQYGEYNIRSYTVALGSIKTPGTYDRLTQDERIKLAEETSLKRWGEPLEIAKLIYALTRDYFSFVNGQTIIADGGVIMH